MNKVILIILCIAMMGTLIFYSSFFSNKNTLICQATSIIHGDELSKTLKINTVLHINGDDDYFEVSMRLNDAMKNNSMFETHRIISFSYEKNGNLYTLFSEPSTDSILSTEIRNKLNDYLPDFFLISYRGIKLKIIKLNSQNFMLYVDRLPVFYCTKKSE